jgi:general secretion pathway protein A
MYENYYGMRAQPFRLTPDPNFFFTGATHKSALAHLRYGLLQEEGFIVVSGAVGTGKTTLALTLLGELSRGDMVIGELVTTQLQPEDLLRAIAAAFQLGGDGTKSNLLARLQAFFTAHTRAGKHVLLVVDEAHNLPQSSFEELRMLSNFHRGPQAMLQCILLGQPPLRDMLTQANMEQFQQRVIAAHHLNPLCPEETRGYILHRLCQAGWCGDPSFTAEAIQYVHRYTQGIPRLINALCNRIMLYGYLEEKHQIDASATTHAYSEWAQETGQMGSVEPLLQRQLEEINFAGLEREHAAVGRAVGADAPAFSTAPAARATSTVAATPNASMPTAAQSTPTYVRSEASMPTRPSAAPSYILNNYTRDALSPPALARHIAQFFSRLVSDLASLSSHLSPTLSRARPLLLPLAAGAVVLAAGFIFLTTYNSHERTAKDIAAIPAPPSRGQAALAPTELKNVVANLVDAAVPVDDPPLLPAAAPPSEAPASEIDKTPALAKVDTLSEPSPPAMEITRPAHDTQAVHVSQAAVAETGLAATPPLPNVKARPKQTATAMTAKVTQRKMTKPRQATFSPMPTPTAAVVTVPANPQSQSIAATDHTDPASTEGTAAHQAMPISENELSAVLDRFREAYVTGDMNELVQLFARDARSDEDGNREAIARSYQKLFNITDERRLALNDLRWRDVGDAVQGVGHFGVTVKEKGRDWESSYRGDISLRIQKRDGQVLITKLDHSYVQ